MIHTSTPCRGGIVVGALLLLASCAARAPLVSFSPAELVNNVEAAEQILRQERARLARGPATAPRVFAMVRFGMWDEAESLLERVSRPGVEFRVAEAELRFRQHRYSNAARLTEAALAANPHHTGAQLMHARLQIQAWQLPEAEAALRSVLAADAGHQDALLLIGRIRLLQQDYPEALRIARQVQALNSRKASAYLLEADTRFWDQDPAGAEPPLVRALELDPFDADARFNYGYAIWRRVDATQLDAMAAQWRLALEVDPLHYVTHWHWGNGHTQLTYADYAEPSDTTVRERLAPADGLISDGDIPSALQWARSVEAEFPESVLPAMLRASAFYMAYDMDRSMRLDSAETIFRSILQRKRNYGPAHNGLAAVIKQRQIEVLARFDSLNAVIENTALTPDPALAAVIPDVRYYPGDRVEKMVRQQLGPSSAYLPMIRRQERRYRLPPLHHDLARTMGQVFFRTATTFDNRQWMDIRGVGSGAAGIEYLERGSYQERDVFLHEFVHLFHSIVFTDQESRRVRQLYHDAVAAGRTLDYYAANNEHEFLAQAYPAYLSPAKIHPLNHKSMATHDLLRELDPPTYAFIDSLVTRQRAYLAGDGWALRSNWAQVYVNLSESARRDSRLSVTLRNTQAAMLLDSALVHDPSYIPAMLSYAALERDRSRFADAEIWLARADALDPGYAPTYRARAELLGARSRASGRDAMTVDERAGLYRRALALEADLAGRAQLNQALRELYRSHGRLPEAIRAAEEYVATAPTISTYLRDRRDEAAAYSQELRSRAGYSEQALDFFRALSMQKPQNYALRAQFVDALAGAGRLEEADSVVVEAISLLRAGGTTSVALVARAAEIRLLQGDTIGARRVTQPVLDDERQAALADLRLVRVLQSLGMTTEAHRRLDGFVAGETPAARADHLFTRGWLAQWRGDAMLAEQHHREALRLDPYHREARVALIGVLRSRGREAEAAEVIWSGRNLPLPLGPDFERQLGL
jgi:predicted Zn-dependent protease